MIVRLWYRPMGREDGLWWTVQVGDEIRDAASVSGSCAWSTGWERDATRPRDEQRHFIEAEAESIDWVGDSVALS